MTYPGLPYAYQRSKNTIFDINRRSKTHVARILYQYSFGFTVPDLIWVWVVYHIDMIPGAAPGVYGGRDIWEPEIETPEKPGSTKVEFLTGVFESVSDPNPSVSAKTPPEV